MALTIASSTARRMPNSSLLVKPAVWAGCKMAWRTAGRSVGVRTEAAPAVNQSGIGETQFSPARGKVLQPSHIDYLVDGIFENRRVVRTLQCLCESEGGRCS